MKKPKLKKIKCKFCDFSFESTGLYMSDHRMLTDHAYAAHWEKTHLFLKKIREECTDALMFCAKEIRG